MNEPKVTANARQPQSETLGGPRFERRKNREGGDSDHQVLRRRLNRSVSSLIDKHGWPLLTRGLERFLRDGFERYILTFQVLIEETVGQLANLCVIEYGTPVPRT